MARDTTLATLSGKAKLKNNLDPVKLKATRGGNVLTFTVSCWIAALVIRPLLERDGWLVEEL